MTEYTVPAVHKGIAAILSHLSVEKNGQLPANMGGKAYISAVDLSAEVKRKFVEHNLILLPNESIERHEIVVDPDKRKTTTMTVRGEYTIISTEDGSSVTVAGLGDGLSTGSSVAANIASTNALKNALLRTFLVTEQSVEDEGKAGPRESSAPTPAAPVEDGRAAVIDRIKKASTAVKDSDGNTGSKLLSALVEANPGEFSNAAGEPQSFQSVWANAPIDVLERLEKLLGSVK